MNYQINIHLDNKGIFTFEREFESETQVLKFIKKLSKEDAIIDSSLEEPFFINGNHVVAIIAKKIEPIQEAHGQDDQKNPQEDGVFGQITKAIGKFR